MKANFVRQCVAAGQPGTLSARPATLRACRARTPHSRQPYAVIVLALASPPSPPSGHTPGGPVWLASRGAGSAIARSASSESSSLLPALDSGGYNGAGSGSGGNEGGSSGWGGGGGNDGQGESAEELFKAAGRTLESLPPDLAAALAAGKLSLDVLARYLRLSNGPLGPFMKLGGFRERLLADPSFMVKVAIEVGIGIFTKSTAEYTKRGENFNKELDFVAANIVMALVADFMLVWLPAPTLSFAARSSAKRGGLAAFLASCPENAFQKVPQGYAPFSPAQRLGAVLRNGAKLAAVGFGSSLIGVTATNVLVGARQMLDPAFVPPNAPQDVLNMSLAYGVYMAVSSNLRYQVIAGVVEQRGIEAVLANSPSACHALSLVVRTSNTFLGSLMWVDWLRFLGLQ